jgi:uronate dehydrogenase
MQRVLVTGAAGGIGRMLRRLMPGLYREIVWSHRRELPDRQPNELFRAIELSDMDSVMRGLEGIDGIVHMGGVSVERPWEEVLQSNIVGGHNLFEAARQQGVQRIVFASTNHVVGFYPRHRKVGVNAALRPDTRYGVSKAFGEALGALYAYKHGLKVTNLRIGNVAEQPADIRRMAIWLHPEDLVQLIRIGLEHPAIRYAIFYGASANARSWWDDCEARRFGYRPKHRSEDHRLFAEEGQAQLAPDPVGDWYQGGPFCSAEYDSKDELAET